MSEFLLIALGTLASEDLTCVAAGILISQGRIGFVFGMLACFTGIVIGDILLFLCGRWFGRIALNRWPLSRVLSEPQVETASQWLARRGRSVVLWSRFAPGLRLPTYFAAGGLRADPWPFTGYFLIAAALWTPLLVGFSVVCGDRTANLFGTHSSYALAFLTLGTLGLGRLALAIKPRAVRLIRSKRWEFWPAWAVYLPVIPYLIILAVKYRSLTLFTAANPGMFTGGFVGESKSEILSHLKKVPGAVADFEVIESGCAAYEAPEYPIVLKPDRGERGSGVAVIRSREELEAYLKDSRGTIIAQKYIPGVEFGVFYCRYPGQSKGTIVSITHKIFPSVTGDGCRTIGELIAADERASCIDHAYKTSCKRPFNDIPASGEQVPLVEIGSHCRGAVFLDGGRWKTPALEDAIERISRSHPGFYFGRYDVRAESIAALQSGKFTVIELNGVSAEPIHIYDPAVGVFEAYRTLFRHWRIAFEIGAINRGAAAQPTSCRTMIRALRERSAGNNTGRPRVHAWRRHSDAIRDDAVLLAEVHARGSSPDNRNRFDHDTKAA